MSNLEARLARLEQQFSVLLANPNTRPALRSATAVPVEDAAVTTAKLAATVTSKLWQGPTNLGGDIVTLVGTATTATSSLMCLNANSYPATLDYLGTSLPDGTLVILRGSGSGTITVQNAGIGTNRIILPTSCDLTSAYDTLTLVRASTRWCEVARAIAP